MEKMIKILIIVCLLAVNGFTARSFNGVDQGILTTIPCTSLVNYTFMMWVNAEAIADFKCPLGCAYSIGGRGFYFRWNGTTIETVHSAGATATSASLVWTFGTWYHLAGTFNGSVIKVYRDGVEIATANSVAAIEQFGAFVTIGGYYYDSAPDAYGHKGKIDNVKIWKYALSPTQIREEMYCKYPMAVGCLAWFPMYSYEGTNIKDYSGNNHSGVIDAIYTAPKCAIYTSGFPLLLDMLPL